MLTDALLVVVGYVVGSMPFGYWLPLLLRGEDIRRQGSGNVGASNVFRVYGRSLGVPVAVLDVLKGFAPTLLALEIAGEWAGVLAGAAAMAGHARPLFLRFQKGGKMVATAGGVSFALAPAAAACCLAVWLVVFLLTRYASVASLATAAALPVLCFAFGEPWPTTVFAVVAFAAVFFMHRQNIRRLLAGEESRFELRRATGTGDARR
jgi:glycerol-3-phosphate acyltransferase PlsY